MTHTGAGRHPLPHEHPRAGRRNRRGALGPWLRTAVRVAVGAVWVIAGLLKLPDPAAERAVRAYQLAPEMLVPALAFGLPVVEIAVGLLLLVGVLVRPAAVTSAVLLAGFIAAVASAWARGLMIDCGCFGGGSRSQPIRPARPD